ncbi:HNH endonuclease [Microbulbifer sp. M83]|uniref:HNH endonuclease n=1 Tax=Microbulbifer sp. M83 TaxID=3118246 RepID=UPI002FE0B5C4
MLNSLEIEQQLMSLGFAQNPIKKKRIHEFTLGDLVVYTKTVTNKTAVDYVSKRPLVIQPEMVIRRAQIDRLPGIDPDWATYYHNSNMTAFSKGRTKNGKNNHRGIAVNVASPKALEQLLATISERPPAEPPSPLEDIEAATDLPASETERQTLVDARIGQGQFRRDLLSYWGQCAVTGIAEPLLLRASHIKPWRESDNRERLDPYNGLLLSAHLDAAFDSGLISFADSGSALISEQFLDADKLGITDSLALATIEPKHLPYLQWHRTYVYRG